ncbi:MAG TPA: ornithine carbamoyltransferase, partial [Thermoanaerobaculia bacterium]|nr:ornithine carbamoyltransferase [Thermoanaerobaculia bacterium]
MPVRHALSIADLDASDLRHIVERSVRFGSGRMADARPLVGRIVGIYFRKPSTRTRTSFTAAAIRLGAIPIAYGPGDLQITTGETLEDTARTLSGYLDILVIRTNESMEEMRTLAAVQNEMAIVNALTEDEHPTQAIADLGTLLETFGRLQDLHVLYLGEGNSTAAALALSMATLPGMQLTLVTPEGYGLPAPQLERARKLATETGSVIEQHHDMAELPRNVDAVYTSRWQTMGVTKGGDAWRDRFAPYKVTAEVMARVSKTSDTIFLHDLPAVRGEDVD